VADDPTAALPSTMDAVPPSATRAPTPLPVPRDGARTLDSATVSMYLRDPRLAITEAGVVCLVCGRSLRHLTNTHLRRHALTSEEYKRQFGYNLRRALMITRVRDVHADNAVKSGLAERIRHRPILEGVGLRRMGGRHPHALEESLTRRDRFAQRSPFAWCRDDRGRFSGTSAPVTLGHPKRAFP